MNFEGLVQKSAPRPPSRCGAMVAPKQDARWRSVPSKVRVINTVRRLEAQQRAR